MRGRQVLPSPGRNLHPWQVAGLYLEQSVSWEGKGNAAVSEDTLGHFSSISIWHRRALGQRNQGGSFSHQNTDSAHRAKGFVSQQLPAPTCECGRAEDIPGARHSGGRSAAWQWHMQLSCIWTWRDSSSISLGVKNWSHKLKWT